MLLRTDSSLILSPLSVDALSQIELPVVVISPVDPCPIGLEFVYTPVNDMVCLSECFPSEILNA